MLMNGGQHIALSIRYCGDAWGPSLMNNCFPISKNFYRHRTNYEKEAAALALHSSNYPTRAKLATSKLPNSNRKRNFVVGHSGKKNER